MHDNMAYFKGWKDSCDDSAALIDNISNNCPEELNEVRRMLLIISQAIRSKGEVGFAMAQSVGESKQ